MKKRILIGLITCIFVLLSFPTVNAIQLNDHIKNTDLKNRNLFSMYQDIINKDSSLLQGEIGATIVGIILLILLIIYYFSGHIEEAEQAPDITFTKDETNHTITVVSTPQNIPWNNIDINGNCNTSELKQYVTPGDKITDCNGEIEIIYNPTNEILEIYQFN